MNKHLILLSISIFIFLNSCRHQNSGAQTSADLEYAIAYNVLIDDSTDNYEVFVMNMDGSGKTNVTNLPGVEWTYHSYADRLYFISDKDTCHRCYFLYATNARGENPVKIYDVQLADSWMSSRRNGQELIVRPSGKVDSALHIITKNGVLVQRLETGLPFSSDPMFLPVGERVIFRGGSTKSKFIEGFDEALYIVDVDGNNLQRLTHYPAQDTTAGKYGYRAGPPKWHPTEKFISYQSKQSGKSSLYAVTPDGSRHWKLTDLDAYEGWHEWSPDGEWLAIELYNKDQSQFHIGLMNWATKDLTILTETNYRFQQAPNFVLMN